MIWTKCLILRCVTPMGVSLGCCPQSPWPLGRDPGWLCGDLPWVVWTCIPPSLWGAVREGLGCRCGLGWGSWGQFSPVSRCNPEPFPDVTFPNDQVKSRSGHSRAPLSGTVLYIKTFFSLLFSPWLSLNLEQQPNRPCPQVPCPNWVQIGSQECSGWQKTKLAFTLEKFCNLEQGMCEA